MQNDEKTLVFFDQVRCSELSDVRLETVKAKLTETFRNALANRPSLILFDDLDLLIPESSEDQPVTQKKSKIFLFPLI